MPQQLITSERVDAYFATLATFHRRTEVAIAGQTRADFAGGIDAVIQRALATHENGGKLIFIGNTLYPDDRSVFLGDL